jgi:hypothetical protein
MGRDVFRVATLAAKSSEVEQETPKATGHQLGPREWRWRIGRVHEWIEGSSPQQSQWGSRHTVDHHKTEPPTSSEDPIDTSV